MKENVGIEKKGEEKLRRKEKGEEVMKERRRGVMTQGNHDSFSCSC